MESAKSANFDYCPSPFNIQYSQIVSQLSLFSRAQVIHDGWVRVLVSHVRRTVLLQTDN